MKKFVLALLALSVASLSYANSGCSGGCDKDKPADKKEETKS